MSVALQHMRSIRGRTDIAGEVHDLELPNSLKPSLMLRDDVLHNPADQGEHAVGLFHGKCSRHVGRVPEGDAPVKAHPSLRSARRSEGNTLFRQERDRVVTLGRVRIRLAVRASPL